jgi:2-polyprenyl-3-methyl-5-hydroxy-6-metoxy-1,4-benzoquinol methylase
LVSDKIDEHTEEVKSEYENHMETQNVDTPEAAHWVGKDKTRLRFDVLTQVDNLDGKKILDFGCGNALLLDFLKEEGVDCDYHGWDISEEMVKVARERHPDAKFLSINILEEDISEYEQKFDYVLVSGVFHIKTDTPREVHRKWTQKIMTELWKLCKGGMAVNFFTEHVDWREEKYYYCDIDDLIAFCMDELSRWFSLRRDYELYEHTMYVYNEPMVKL